MVGRGNKSGLVHFILGLLSSRATGQIIGLVAVLSLVWFVGGYIGLDSVDKRLIAMAVVLSAFLVFIFVRWFWTRRSGEKLANELAGHNASSDAEIDEIREKMQEALTSLKASHLGAGYRGSTALYALPWYMIIGPSAAGKSTLFANSGLHFPYSNSNQLHIQGFGGTRNCDWWFSDQAVLIDTAGRYTTDDSENPEWLSFLNLLKKYRPKLPINGVMVAISIADILTADSEQIRTHVKLIRERIEELVQQLGVIFPVHVVFTKTDLISGFEPFFSDLDDKAREQVWGTYLLDLSEDQQKDAAQLFEQRMAELYDRLCEQRIAKMSRERNEQRKQLIFDFPNQFASATGKLTEFINLLFKENPYQEVPWFAGVYFTSGTQEGTPIERIATGALAKFRSVLFEQKQETITQSFFINRVFNDVVFRLQDLTRGNRKRRIIQRWLKALTVTGGLVSIASITALLITSYTANNVLISDGEQKVHAVVQTNVSSATHSEQLDATLVLFKHYQQLMNYEQSLPWYFFFGIYEGDDTIEPIVSVLRYQVKKLIARPVESENSLALEQFHHKWSELQFKGSLDSIRSDYYRALKLHLMMSKFTDKIESQFVNNEVLKVLANSLQVDFSNEEYAPLTDNLKNLIEFYLAQLAMSKNSENKVQLSYWDYDDSNVEVARASLLTQPEAGSLYKQIKQEIGKKHKPLSLNSLLGAKNRSYMRAKKGVPFIFTQKGWTELIYPKIMETARLAYSGDWVMGTDLDQQDGTIDEAKSANLAKAIRSLYFNEYAKTWFSFLSSIYIPSFNSTNNASLVMARLSSINGPYVDLMRGLNANIQLADHPTFKNNDIDDTEKLLTQVVKEVPALNNISITKAPELDARFADLRRYTTIKDGAKYSDYLQQYLGAMTDFHTDLKRLAASNSDDHVAMSFAQGLLGGSEKDNALQSAWIVIESQVRALEPESKQVLDTLLKAPLIRSLDSIMKEARTQLNTQWESQVYTIYRDNLKGKFPFNTKGPDAAAEDVSEFLNSQSGVLWRFVNDYLSPFMQLKRRKWAEKNWNGIKLGIEKEVLEKFNAANTVTRSLFPRNSSELGIEFQLMPIPQRGIRETYLGFSDQAYRYRNEPEEWRRFSWPGKGGIEKATVYGLNAQGVRLNHEESGPWALIRLLNKAKVKWVKGAEYRAIWALNNDDDKSKIKIEMALKSSRNSGAFSKYTLNAFSLPESLFNSSVAVAENTQKQLN